MILSWEDIIGGSTLASFLIWVILTGLFYLVFYLAVLNTIDEFTKNSFLKIPILLIVSPLSAFIMAIFKYSPLVLIVLISISNFYRVKGIAQSGLKNHKNLKIIQPLFFAASYLYIVFLFVLSLWFQTPVEKAGVTQPLWQSWFPNEMN